MKDILEKAGFPVETKVVGGANRLETILWKEMNRFYCNHELDKNFTHCIKCGTKVVSRNYRPATPAEQKAWAENPQKFIESLKLTPNINKKIN